MSEFWAVREGMMLRPFGAESADVLSKLSLGKVLRIEVKQPRNGKHHRLFWTLCQRIASAIGSDSENVSDLLKIGTGHCTVVRSAKYGELRLPKSISFAAMDQAAFSTFFDACIRVVHEEWGIERSDITAAIADLMEDAA